MDGSLLHRRLLGRLLLIVVVWLLGLVHHRHHGHHRHHVVHHGVHPLGVAVVVLSWHLHHVHSSGVVRHAHVVLWPHVHHVHHHHHEHRVVHVLLHLGIHVLLRLAHLLLGILLLLSLQLVLVLEEHALSLSIGEQLGHLISFLETLHLVQGSLGLFVALKVHEGELGLVADVSGHIAGLSHGNGGDLSTLAEDLGESLVIYLVIQVLQEHVGVLVVPLEVFK